MAGFIFFNRVSKMPAERQAIVVACLLVPVALSALYLFKKNRLAASLQEIDTMSGHEFERFLACLFKRMGYRTRLVGASGGDFGADLVIEKGGVSIAVQAKNYELGHVGNDAVQQVIAGTTYYNCQAALVVTNSLYTKAAIEQARGCTVFPVTLWNRYDLEMVLRKHRGMLLKNAV